MGTTTAKEDVLPNIYAAISNVAFDNGMVNIHTTLESHMEIPARWDPWLPQIELALSRLSSDTVAPEDVDSVEYLQKNPDAPVDREFLSEFNCFCNGEHDAQIAIRDRTLDGILASNFLNDFFEGWTYFSDDELFDPEHVHGG